MIGKTISEAKSLRGYNLWTWFKGNWKTIKEVLKAGIPLLIGWATTNNPALIGLITISGKFLLDMGEFYFKEITIK